VNSSSVAALEYLAGQHDSCPRRNIVIIRDKKVQVAMPVPMQTTVDRLDKPSAYYLGRVSTTPTAKRRLTMVCQRLTQDRVWQNKKRKYGRDRDDDDVGRQKTPEEPEDPLKDAATLYVGNLCVQKLGPGSMRGEVLTNALQVILHYRRADTRAFC